MFPKFTQCVFHLFLIKFMHITCKFIYHPFSHYYAFSPSMRPICRWTREWIIAWVFWWCFPGPINFFFLNLPLQPTQLDTNGFQQH
jgi:hypothetical protein